MFGQQRAPFGSTTSTFGTGFGTPNTTTGTTGFGTNSFGRTAFGNPQQTTSFGATTTPFGAATSTGTSLFGTQTQQTGGGLFGQQQPQQTSTSFSQPSTGFGTSSGGLFGQTQQPTATGLFGSGTTGGFGAQQSTQNRPFGFGQTITSSTSTAGGLFSSTQPATGGGLFSSSGFGAAGTLTGTTVKYEPVTGSDTMTRNGVSTNIRTKIEVISTMKEYENKSLEELRVEDYLANRKGPTSGTTMPGFGQTQQQGTQPQLGSTGLFGSSSGTSLFATTKPPENKSLFGTTTSTGFGTPTGGSLFGTSASTPGFGQTSTAPNTSFSFNTQQQQKSTGFNFGGTATTTPSLFGSTPQQQQQQQQSGFGLGGFQLGQNTQQQNTGGLFGNQNKPGGFLSTQNTGGGLFGNKPAGITPSLSTGFGNTSAVTPFGTATNTSTGGGLFGAQNTQNKTGIFSGFNSNTGFGSTGLFGQNNNQQKPGAGLSFSQFGSTNTMGQSLGTNPGGVLFNPGGTNTGMGMTGIGLLNTNTGFGMPQLNMMGNTGGGMFPDLGKLVKAMTEKPIFDIPWGSKSSPVTDKTSSTSNSDEVSSKLASSNQKPTYVLSPSLVANNKPRPKPINKANNQGNDRHWLFKGLEDPSEESSEDFLKPKKYPSVRKLNLRVFKSVKPDTTSLGSPTTREDGDSSGGNAPSPLTTPISTLGDNTPLRPSGPPSHDNYPMPDMKGRNKVKRLNLADKHGQINDTLTDLNVNHLKVTEPADENTEADDLADKDKSHFDAEANKENNVSLFNSVDEDIPEILNRSSDKSHPAGVKLTRSGYYTLPSLEDLGEMVDSEGRCLVENFTVGRYGYGNVCFLGVTDVAGLDLDAVVFILRKQIEVYPEGTQKPPQGQELNKPAVITLDCVWPVDKTTREVIKSSDRLQSMAWGDYLERQCVKMEATFLEYRPETGSWVFKVKHFSKYGLQEDNEEEAMVTVSPKTNQSQPTPPQSTAQSGATAATTQLPALTMRISGPPVTTLTSSPQFGLGQMALSGLSSKQVSQPRYLDSPHQDIQVPEDEVMDSTIAKEPEESASLSVLSPSSERLAVLSRVVPRTVQLAKSQLFGADDDYEEPIQTTRESTPTPQGHRISSKKLMLAPDSSLNRSQGATMSPAPSEPKSRVPLQLQPLTMASPPKSNVQSETCFIPLLRDARCEYEVLPSGHDEGKEMGHVPPQHQTSIVPFATSLMNGLDHCLSDMGAFMGRSFRVGWGPGWQLVHAGSQLASTAMEEYNEDVGSAVAMKPSLSPACFLFLGSLASQPKTAQNAESPRYNLLIEKLHTVPPQSRTIHHLTEASLECVLEHSFLDIDEMSESKDPKCPFFRPSKDIEFLHQLAETAASFSQEDSTISNIFNLCVALWGRLDFYSPESDGESDYSVSRARVEAVSQWLEAVSYTTVQEEVSDALNKKQNDEGYLDAVFAHLTARQISEACLLAQDKGDHHLALLLAQACLGQDTPRQILAQQLSNWAEGGTDALMAPSRLVLYSLLAAAPTHQASHTTVNTCQGLDWRRAFALHLWYVCPATSTISEALQEYEQAAGLRGDAPSYCEAPLPPYLAYQALPNGMKASYDICYHLLKLFTDPMHQLEALLNPATITPDPLDVTVSWLLWRILESLSYQHLSPQLSASLHLSMAALMESEGHWHWAIFVLLSINDEERRSKEVKELLQRHVAVGEEEESDPKYAMREDFVITKLNIPTKWIHQAKATKARSLNMVDEEAWYLLKAGDYNRAHMLIVDTIAPNSIINEDHQYLHGFLDQLCDDGIRSTLVDWAVGGGVYADYLDVCSVVDDMKKSADPTPAQLEQLRPRLLALCSRLNNLKCQTATHRLCVSEMSRVVVGVLRAVVGESTDATQVLSQQLSGLPLTHDYALTELNMVTTHYLTHLSAESWKG